MLQIHLDSPLTGLSAYPDAPVEMLRTATRDAFTNLVNEAIEQLVDFIGDCRRPVRWHLERPQHGHLFL